MVTLEPERRNRSWVAIRLWHSKLRNPNSSTSASLYVLIIRSIAVRNRWRDENGSRTASNLLFNSLLPNLLSRRLNLSIATSLEPFKTSTSGQAWNKLCQALEGRQEDFQTICPSHQVWPSGAAPTDAEARRRVARLNGWCYDLAIRWEDN